MRRSRTLPENMDPYQSAGQSQGYSHTKSSYIHNTEGGVRMWRLDGFWRVTWRLTKNRVEEGKASRSSPNTCRARLPLPRILHTGVCLVFICVYSGVLMNCVVASCCWLRVTNAEAYGLIVSEDQPNDALVLWRRVFFLISPLCLAGCPSD